MPEKRRIHIPVIFFYFISAGICFLDQLAKAGMERFTSPGSSVPVIQNILHITLIYNTGAAFGLFARWPHLFSAVGALICALILYLLARNNKKLSGSEKCALSFVLGGALGNLTDRIRLGYVIDFIDFRIWPAFNVADSFITVGALLLAWALFMKRPLASRGINEA